MAAASGWRAWSAAAGPWTCCSEAIASARSRPNASGSSTASCQRPTLKAEALALSQQLAGKAPLAVRYLLNAVYAGADLPLEHALQLEATLFGLSASTEDMKEGTRAFLEKRKPTFTGR